MSRPKGSFNRPTMKTIVQGLGEALDLLAEPRLYFRMTDDDLTKYQALRRKLRAFMDQSMERA